MSRDVAQTLVSAAPRLVSASLAPRARLLGDSCRCLRTLALSADNVDTSVDAADKSVCATGLIQIPRSIHFRPATTGVQRLVSASLAAGQSPSIFLEGYSQGVLILSSLPVWNRIILFPGVIRSAATPGGARRCENLRETCCCRSTFPSDRRERPPTPWHWPRSSAPN